MSPAQSDEPLWASLPVPALVVDAADRIVRINPAAEGFLLASQRAVAGDPVWDRLAVDAPLEDALARARTSGAPLFVNDVDIGTGARPPMLCNLHVAPMAGATGQMLILLSPRELAGRMAQKSGVKAAARSAIGMAEMLAHEIKNPLAGITGAAQLLSMNASAGDRELTDLIVAESRRIVGLLDRVEQFGNVTRPVLRRVNLHDVLDRARRSATVGFAAGLRIVEAYDPSLPHALGDADQLLQVMLNLLKNAAEAAPAGGGSIRLHSYYDGALRVRGDDGPGHALPLQIEIIDDGPGLPPDIAEEVFEPFVSGRENGTGLGLALAAKIVSEHGGWISVNSVPGRTVFRISLPRADAQDEEGG
jgi:two-component system nitrogen regulation sensor histidine kinase GlnL